MSWEESLRGGAARAGGGRGGPGGKEGGRGAGGSALRVDTTNLSSPNDAAAEGGEGSPMLPSGYTAELAVRRKKSEGGSSQQVKTPEGGSESSTKSIVRSDGMDSMHRWLQVYFAATYSIYRKIHCARLMSTS